VPALIEDILPVVFTLPNQRFVFVTTQPGKILQASTVTVALWAQVVEGEDRNIDMRMPGITRVLKNLAGNGLGWAEKHNRVRFRFISSKSFCLSRIHDSSAQLLKGPPRGVNHRVLTGWQM
jgi:hypothetical protein